MPSVRKFGRFQSAPPVKGASDVNSGVFHLFPVSIRAPREGGVSGILQSFRKEGKKSYLREPI